jgi:hypothetical protein
MTDLTLNEYKGLSEEKLRQVLKEEARIICGPDLLKNNFKDTGKRFYHIPRSKHNKAKKSSPSLV